MNKQCEICSKNLNKTQKRFCSLKCVGVDSSERMQGNKHGRLSHTKFKKGRATWNKGTKGLIKPNSGSFTSEGTKGEKNLHWKGNGVGYGALHDWVRSRLGEPKKCEYCGKDNLTGHKIHWANKSRKFLRDVNDWLRLCGR